MTKTAFYRYNIKNGSFIIENNNRRVSIPTNKIELGKNRNAELARDLLYELGTNSTLLKASNTTNFIYKISNLNLSSEQISEINAIDTRSKIKDRIEKVKQLKGKLQFDKPENPLFESNLVLIDSALPKIISEILLLFFTSNYFKTSDLVEKISTTKPLGYNLENNNLFYSYKIKHFLTHIALGLMPSKVWTGELDATAGCIIVKDNGEVLCYHIYNRNEFEDYLFTNTKLETASSTRHAFGIIYEHNGELHFKLNLQIRFN